MDCLMSVYVGLNVLVGLLSIVLQAVIIASYGDCSYSKMGVGIWNGALLLMTAITICVVFTRSKTGKGDSIIAMCAMTLLASLVQGGVACGVIYQIHSLEYFEHDFRIGSVSDLAGEATKLLFGNANAIINKFGRSLANNGVKHIQIRTCYNLSISENYTGNERKTLEIALLACALIAFCVQIATLVALRMKRLIVSATIHYTNRVVADSKDNMLTA